MSSPLPARPDRSGLTAWLWTLAVLALSLSHLLCFPTLWDDAFISFRVAERWAETGAYAFAPGPPQWVATNFLWVAALAGSHRLTGWPVPDLARGLGLAAGLLAPLLCYWGWRRLDRPEAAPPAGMLCAAASVWAAWPGSGLETSAFGLWVLAGTLGLLVYFRSPQRGWLWVSALAWGLATLTRPEGAWLFALSGLMLLTQRPAGASAVWSYAGVYVAVLAPAAAFLWGQCHTLVPNAFYAKLHGLANLRSGQAYLQDFLHTTRAVYWLPFLLPAFARDDAPVQARFLVLLLLGWTAWVAVSGGDFMPFHRFVAPVWPLVCLLLGSGMAKLGSMLRAVLPVPPPAAAALTAVLWAFLMLPLGLPTFVGAHHDRVRAWAAEEADRARVGRWLARTAAPGTLLALKPAGIIPYYSGLPAVDFYGLLDARAAREGAWDPAGWPGHQRIAVRQVLDRAPRIVILDERLYPVDRLPDPGSEPGPVEQAWRTDPRRAAYTALRAEVAPGRWLQYYMRK